MTWMNDACQMFSCTKYCLHTSTISHTHSRPHSIAISLQNQRCVGKIFYAQPIYLSTCKSDHLRIFWEYLWSLACPLIRRCSPTACFTEISPNIPSMERLQCRYEQDVPWEAGDLCAKLNICMCRVAVCVCVNNILLVCIQYELHV